MAIYFPGPGVGITLEELRDSVNMRLENTGTVAAADATGDGIATVFELPHANIHSGTVTATVDGGSETYSVDYPNGVLTFATAPADEAAIHVVYTYSRWTDTQVDEAINEALIGAWAEFHAHVLDTTTITPDGTTTDFDLPTDCAYLYRVEYRSDSSSPYTKVRQWGVSDADDYTSKLILYKPESSGTYRLRYIKSHDELVLDADTMEDAGIPAQAKPGIVWTACAFLLAQTMGARTRGNQFYNVEGPNVAKIYEIQRVMADYQALAELAYKKARRNPRVNTA